MAEDIFLRGLIAVILFFPKDSVEVVLLMDRDKALLEEGRQRDDFIGVVIELGYSLDSIIEVISEQGADIAVL